MPTCALCGKPILVSVEPHVMHCHVDDHRRIVRRWEHRTATCGRIKLNRDVAPIPMQFVTYGYDPKEAQRANAERKRGPR